MSSGGETAAINNLRHMITSARGPLCDGLVGGGGGHLCLVSRVDREMSPREQGRQSW